MKTNFGWTVKAFARKFFWEWNVHWGVKLHLFPASSQKTIFLFYLKRELCNYIYRYSIIERAVKLILHGIGSNLNNVMRIFVGVSMRLILWARYLSTETCMQMKIVVRVQLSLRVIFSTLPNRQLYAIYVFGRNWNHKCVHNAFRVRLAWLDRLQNSYE